MKRVFLCCTLLTSAALGAERKMEPKDLKNNSSQEKEALFEKPSRKELEKRLTPLQCQVTQDGATERPFHNEYWNHKSPGIYVDIVSGEPLFSSVDKFDSGSGWPSFTKPIESKSVIFKKDLSHGMDRTEIRSKKANSHLGHVFDDGPGPTKERYCVNSASLKFIGVDELEAKGYGQYKSLFTASNTEKDKSNLISKLQQAAPKTDFVQDVTKDLQLATFAGGCFWGMEEILRSIKGVIQTQVGYTGGSLSKPTYNDVKTGKTGHAESIQVLFDPKKLSYDELVHWFFRMHDPTTPNRQGNDIGTQYRSVIFAYTEAQKKTAATVKERIEKGGKLKASIVTEIRDADIFWRAEESHQKYLQKNPGGYTCHYLREL